MLHRCALECLKYRLFLSGAIAKKRSRACFFEGRNITPDLSLSASPLCVNLQENKRTSKRKTIKLFIKKQLVPKNNEIKKHFVKHKITSDRRLLPDRLNIYLDRNIAAANGSMHKLCHTALEQFPKRVLEVLLLLGRSSDFDLSTDLYFVSLALSYLPLSNQIQLFRLSDSKHCLSFSRYVRFYLRLGRLLSSCTNSLWSKLYPFLDRFSDNELRGQQHTIKRTAHKNGSTTKEGVEH